MLLGKWCYIKLIYSKMLFLILLDWYYYTLRFIFYMYVNVHSSDLYIFEAR